MRAIKWSVVVNLVAVLGTLPVEAHAQTRWGTPSSGTIRGPSQDQIRRDAEREMQGYRDMAYANLKSKMKEFVTSYANEKNAAPDRLRTLYSAYVITRFCYELRQGYALVYVNETEMQNIVAITKKKEKYFFEKFPDLVSVHMKLWDAAQKIDFTPNTSTLGGLVAATTIVWPKSLPGDLNRLEPDLARSLCRIAADGLLTADSGYSPSIKKDF
jgi:hypothetical protein